MFLCTNFIWPCDLDFRLFEISGVWLIYSFTHTTHISILASYDYQFLIYVWLKLNTLPSPGTVSAYAPRHATSHLEAKIIYYFEILYPQFTYALCHFEAAPTNIKRRYMLIMAVIPLGKLESSLRKRSTMWSVHTGSLNITRNDYLTPNCLFIIQTRVLRHLSWNSMDGLLQYASPGKIKRKALYFTYFARRSLTADWHKFRVSCSWT